MSALAHSNTSKLSSRLLPMSPGTLRSTLLRIIPLDAGPTLLLAKLLLGTLLLLNVRSFPLAWHLRVLGPLLRIHAGTALLRLRTLWLPRAGRQRAMEAFQLSLCPVGEDPIAFTTTYHSWAGPDDCDYNGHLSNSSYAKALDMSRLKAGMASFPLFLHAGGWVALAGTNFAFVREIPMLARYEVRLAIVAWDSKWMYVAARFVTPPTRQARPAPSMPGPAEEPDGATLHCVSVSQCCFKLGRITVPPGVVLASQGFCAPAPHGAPRYSRANPPPHWGHARRVLGAGGAGGYAAFLRGGWRAVQGEGRWWEDALGGGVEERRRANLEVVDLVRKGMEGAAGL